MSVNEARRGNIDYLIKLNGSQSALAEKLGSPVLNQQRLSEIQAKGLPLCSHEAREIEEILGIPKNWLDHNGWLGASSHLRQGYAQLSPAERVLFDETVQFVLDYRR
jgi:hypothetical protein